MKWKDRCRRSWIRKDGYVYVRMPSHPRADYLGWVLEHTLFAEAALGKFLPKDSCVHHVDGNTARNTGENLVICQDSAYHLLLHRRQRALDACGHANWRLCGYCGAHDDTANMIVHGVSRGTCVRYCHRECRIQSHHNKQRRSA